MQCTTVQPLHDAKIDTMHCTEADHKGIPPHHATQWIDIVAQHAKIKFWDRVAMKRFHRPELGEPREFSGPKQNQIV